MNIHEAAKTMLPQMIEWRRFLHQHPETSWEEFQTSDWIAKQLQSFGLAPRKIAGTGIVAEVIGNPLGPMIAFRADLDALAIEEKTQLPFASQVAGKMHACGHDAHMAMLLGVVKVLQENRQDLRGVVRLIFQPAEETPPAGAVRLAQTGAALMVAEGAMQNVQAVFALHVMPQLPCGTIGLRAGWIMAGSLEFELVINGKGGHAGMPAGTVDALAVAAQVVVGLRTAITIGENPLSPLIVHIGKMTAGSHPTAVADEARMLGTIRFTDPTRQTQIVDKIKQVVEQIAGAFGARATLNIFDHVNTPVMNDPRVIGILNDVATGMTVVEPQPLMAAEDFWAYLNHAPGAYIFLGVGDLEKAENPGLHSPLFTLKEEAMVAGVELLLRIARNATCFTF